MVTVGFCLSEEIYGIENSTIMDLPVITDSKLLAKPVVNLSLPTSMAFVGDNDLLVLSDKVGQMYRITNGTLMKDPILDVNVANYSERCFCGLATSQREVGTWNVFLYFTESGTDSDIDEYSGGPEPAGNRLYRYQLVDDKLINRTLLIDLPTKPGPWHNGGAITVGQDGYIYVPIGDLKASESSAGTPEGSFLQKTKAQNYPLGPPVDGRAGILRINPESQWTHNDSSGFPIDLYYAYGIRNSFGLDFDNVTGRLWDTENGPTFGDEINLVEEGFNSGWAKMQGFWTVSLNKSGVFRGALTINPFSSMFDLGTYSSPELAWNYSIGLTALKFFHSDRYGNEYQDDLFVGDIHQGRILRFELNGTRTGLALNGSLADKIVDNSGEEQRHIFARFKPYGVTDIEVSPDGLLYAASYTEGTIYRIVPSHIDTNVEKKGENVLVTEGNVILYYGNNTDDAFQVALKNVYPGQELNVQNGTYKLTRPLIVPKGISVDGEGDLSIFDVSMFNNESAIVLNNDSTLNNVTVVGNYSILQPDLSQKITAANNSILTSINIINMSFGLQISNVKNVTIDDFHCDNLRSPNDLASCIYINNASGVRINNFKITDSNSGIEITSGGRNIMIENGFLSNIKNIKGSVREPFSIGVYSRDGEAANHNISITDILIKDSLPPSTKIASTGQYSIHDLSRHVSFDNVTVINPASRWHVNGDDISIKNSRVMNATRDHSFVLYKNSRNILIENVLSSDLSTDNYFIFNEQDIGVQNISILNNTIINSDNKIGPTILLTNITNLRILGNSISNAPPDITAIQTNRIGGNTNVLDNKVTINLLEKAKQRMCVTVPDYEEISTDGDRDMTYSFIAVGDWGVNSNTIDTTRNIVSMNPDLILGLGDYSYEHTADCWLEIVDSIDHKMKISLGNHELSAMDQYMRHFNLSEQYYSFTEGNVHFLVMSTETPFDPTSEQFKFVANDLEETSKDEEINWIIVAFHKPAYTSMSEEPSIMSNTAFIKSYHPLFDKYGVDLVLQGHNHIYERSYPLAYNITNSSAPIITSERISEYKDPIGEIYSTVGTAGAPLFRPLNKENHFPVQLMDFGILNIDINDYNSSSSMTAKFHLNSGPVADYFRIIKNNTNGPS